jgi:hypothetical protein
MSCGIIFWGNSADRIKIFKIQNITFRIITVSKKWDSWRDLFTKQTNSVVFNPNVNDTDWVTPTCQWILVPTFADTGVLPGQCDGSLQMLITVLFLEPLFYFQVAPQLSSWGWVEPIPGPLLLRKPGSTGNQPTTRPQRWLRFI